MKTKIANKVAFIYEPEPENEKVERWTYADLNREVCKLANALKKLGVKKGDRITIYLPMIPQLPIAMLACAKIGAVHSIVFSGFSAGSLKDRINDAESKILITADAAYRRGKPVQLKNNADQAVTECPSLQHVIVFNRAHTQVTMTAGRDLWWNEITAQESEQCPTEQLDSEDILYTLYTSGTTGKPKGIVHVHGGYAVGINTTLKFIFDIKESDIWCGYWMGDRS
jgi:acetyl-CoA synthetase